MYPKVYPPAHGSLHPKYMLLNSCNIEYQPLSKRFLLSLSFILCVSTVKLFVQKQRDISSFKRSVFQHCLWQAKRKKKLYVYFSLKWFLICQQWCTAVKPNSPSWTCLWHLQNHHRVGTQTRNASQNHPSEQQWQQLVCLLKHCPYRTILKCR